MTLAIGPRRTISPMVVSEEVTQMLSGALTMNFIDKPIRGRNCFRDIPSRYVTITYTITMITWSQFCKEPLPQHNFTFWEWFYTLMELTRKYLRAPWVDKLIVGFIGRNQIIDMLQESPPGTFIIFFCNVELGAVSIAWVGEGREVSMMDPLKSKDFSIRSLSDRLSELEQLNYLYPDVPKNQAFGRYYTRIQGATSETVPNRTPMSRKEKTKAKKKENAKKKAEEEKAKKQEKKTLEGNQYSRDSDGFESNISRPKKNLDF